MDINFEKILEKLGEIHKEFPNMRFGEAIQKAVDNRKKAHNIDFHNISSKELLSALTEYLQIIKKGGG